MVRNGMVDMGKNVGKIRKGTVVIGSFYPINAFNFRNTGLEIFR